MNWQKEIINVDNREKLSPRILDLAFTLNLTTLDIGDISYKRFLIEIKIANDIRDYARLQDELNRMSRETDKELHAIYIGVSMKDYKVFIGMCQKYGIYGHQLFNLMELNSLCKKIFNGYYTNSKPFFKKPTNKLSPFQRTLACLNGITEQMALECPYSNYLNLVVDVCHKLEYSKLINWLGTKKDGSRKKIINDLIDFLITGGWK